MRNSIENTVKIVWERKNEPTVNMEAVIAGALALKPTWERSFLDDEYRRVKWEQYNPDAIVGVFPPLYTSDTIIDIDGWETEVIKKGKRVYDDYPFSSLPNYVPNKTPLGVEVTDPNVVCELNGSGYWSEKINWCFSSENAFKKYIDDIGSTFTGNELVDGYYGADFSTSDIWVNKTLETAIYKCENSGGIYRNGACYVDERTLMHTTKIEKDGTVTELGAAYWPDIIGGRESNRKDRTTYPMVYKSDPDFDKPDDTPDDYIGGSAYMFNIKLKSPDGTESIPPANPAPTPPPTPVPPLSMPSFPLTTVANAVISSVVGEGGESTSVTVEYPYANLPTAVMGAIGASLVSIQTAAANCMTSFASFEFPGLGVSSYPNDDLGTTMNKGLSDSMSEAKQYAVAIPIAVREAAIKFIKAKLDPILSLVGGSWDLITSLVPTLSIGDLSFDLVDMVFNKENPVQYILDLIYEKAKGSWEVVKEYAEMCYTAIGSMFNYSEKRTTSIRKDIVAAVDTVWSWICMKVEMGVVGLMQYLGGLAEIFTIPPPPNPIWATIKAVNALFETIFDGVLASMASGSFPGFTAADLYALMTKAVDEAVKFAMVQVDLVVDKITAISKQISTYTNSLLDSVREWEEDITNDDRSYWQQLVDESKVKLEELKAQKDALMDTVKDKWKIMLDNLDSLPFVPPINALLGLIGMNLKDLLQLKFNGHNQSTTAGSSFEDEVMTFCKSIMDQLSTFCTTFVTDWSNRITSLLGVTVEFPPITITIPLLPALCFPNPVAPEIPQKPEVPDV